MQKYKKGFTLVELMITMALLAILATVAIPSFQNSIYRKHSETAGYEMASLVRLARSEALVRASEVRICDQIRFNIDTKCPDSGNNWNANVVVAAQKRGVTPIEWEVIATGQVFSSIDTTAGTSSQPIASSIAFDLQGRSVDGAGDLINGIRDIKLCDKKNIACKKFTITPRGRTHVEKYVATSSGS